jgi:branched-chain amino acid transport system substrate-binding protein
MKKQNYLIIGIILAIAIVIGIASTGFLTLNQNNQEEIKIGVMFPLSGDLAAIGNEIVNSLSIALEEINQEGINGKRIKLIYQDSKCDGKEAVNAINKLINIDKVKIVIGEACSGATLAAAPIAENNKVILFSPFSTSPDLTNAGEYIFRTAPSDALQGQKMAEYAIEKEIKTIAIIIEDTEYTYALNKVFKENYEKYGKVVIQENYKSEENDFKTPLLKIINRNPEAIYILPQTPNKLALILRQLKEINYQGKILTSEMADSDELLTNYKEEMEGVVFARVKFDAEKGKSKEFLDKYFKEHGQLPETFGTFFFASAYDSLHIISEAISKCKEVNTECIKPYLHTVKDRPSATGNLTINEYGDSEYEYDVKVIKDGVVRNIN